MLISKKVVSAINHQIGNEFGASLQYVSIASYFASEALLELAAFFYKQAEEERDHAMRFVKFVVDAGGRMEIPPIAAPKNIFKSTVEAIELSLKWETEVTEQINGLVELATREKDHITRDFLSWYLKEQLEEFSTMDTLLKVAQRAGSEVLIVEDYVARHGAKMRASGPGES
jgi:ferritin